MLWRHGRTAWNAERRVQGQLDPPLDDLGERQAVAAAAVLAGRGPAYLVSSDLRRAMATAQRLGSLVGLDPEPDHRLREIDVGRWQGLTLAEVQTAFPEEWAAWRRGDDARRGGGETFAEVAVRAAAAVTDALAQVEPGGTLVAVSHGAAIRALAASLVGVPHPLWGRLGVMDNAGWSVLLEASDGQWRLLSYNERVPLGDGAGEFGAAL